ncbi:extracellular solute-binding protein [Paenibacillus koleovorans]|uniref:extracellular solute-binding protein n=1 Tax=Paenibacillus koleovorans TaxID=121608 RepID=UPI000FDC0689|nr:extracellular solute-binding protein [Paenibacillus koleovorans]
MKVTFKKVPQMIISSGLVIALLAACGSKSPAEPGAEASVKPQETQYLEVWRNMENVGALDKDSAYSKLIQKDIGVGIYAPSVPWNGGSAYVQKLNTRIASGELPDMFLPWQGNEASLMKQGALADLTDLLPKYAPAVWNRIPKEVWDVVRSADPSGKNRIYYIPYAQTYTHYGAFIRQDWLDRVGMKVPTTKDEYVAVLRAFRDKDANGNGDPNDEIPVSGREQGRWMDHLFAMYGIAMLEGIPAWDIYDGKLTYSAVTPNMKAAIEFIRDLYKEKLLDQNTFLNKNDDWLAKIYNDKVGSWYHINYTASARLENIVKVNKDVNLVALGVPKVPGYDGFITKVQISRPQWVIANKNEQTTINALKLLNWTSEPANAEKVLLGVEGMHYSIKDGKPVKIDGDSTNQDFRIMTSFINGMDEMKKQSEVELAAASSATQTNILKQRDKLIADMQKFGKAIAGDGMPASIYDGFSDLKNHTMYQEYMTKIIIGEWPISKFDEFVDKWNKSGGEEVTKRARAWYQSMKP